MHARSFRPLGASSVCSDLRVPAQGFTHHACGLMAAVRRPLRCVQPQQRTCLAYGAHTSHSSTKQQAANRMPAAAGGDETTKAAQEGITTPSAAQSEDAPLGSGGGVADVLGDLRLGERFRGLVRAYNEVEEKGTPLRPYIQSARESLNGAAVVVNSQWVAAKEGACAAVESVKPDLSWISKEVGNVDDFARTHRELVVAGVGLAVAVPSLIGGVRRAAVNGMVAAGLTAGVFGFSEWWDRRQK